MVTRDVLKVLKLHSPTARAILRTFKTSFVPINHEMHSRSYDFLYLSLDKKNVACPLWATVFISLRNRWKRSYSLIYFMFTFLRQKCKHLQPRKALLTANAPACELWTAGFPQLPHVSFHSSAYLWTLWAKRTTATNFSNELEKESKNLTTQCRSYFYPIVIVPWRNDNSSR